jgi:ABC-type Co2+ transport system permease subunit
VVERSLHPITLTAIVALSLAAAAWERCLENAPEFPLGLLLGELSVLTTIALHTYLLLALGEMPPATVLVWMLLHLPLAVIEGIIVGVTVGFLARVKPELLNGGPLLLPGEMSKSASNGVHGSQRLDEA